MYKKNVNALLGIAAAGFVMASNAQASNHDKAKADKHADKHKGEAAKCNGAGGCNGKTFKCEGANTCHTDHNSCKGKGWVMVENKAKCDELKKKH